jgi:hypothetical protein
MATATAARPAARNGQRGSVQTAAPKAAAKPAAKTSTHDDDLIFDLSETPDYGGTPPQNAGMFQVKVLEAKKTESKAGNRAYKVTLTVIAPDEIGASIAKTQALTDKSMGFVKAMARSFGAKDSDMKRLDLGHWVKTGAVGYVHFSPGKMEEVQDEETGELITQRGFYDVDFVTKARYESSLSAAATAEEPSAEEEAPAEEETADDI